MIDMKATFLGLTLTTWATGALVVVLLAVAHLALRWWTGRKLHQHEERPHAPGELAAFRYWVARGLSEAVPPLALLLWVHGLHFAVRVLLSEFDAVYKVDKAFQIADWLQGFGTLLGLAWLLVRVARTLEALLLALSARTEFGWDDVLAPFAGKALRLTLPMIAVIMGTPALAISQEMEGIIQNAASLLLIGTMAFLVMELINVVARFIMQRHRIDVADNRRARAVYTQVMVLKKIATSVVAVIAIASMLMVFQSVRQFGTAIIASAGVAGIILGFAAQKTIATLLAGFQIALTQPIRIDDVVIVENEWGRIEEITLTYVVVRIWDLRRLVLPITYFIEKPFQNWTRTSADILGTVYLHVDYDVPMEALRQELTRILEASKLWDGKVNVLQVTDAKDRTLELRALASARDAGAAWDLRCEVREKLITYLQKHYPNSLPRWRVESHAPARAVA
ncbi:MAG TPA: mechanosensitive ion channel domain-containing protein [Steroidobacter sp.]|uniref:mechanosensitive ion channel family protein n=1 Tax=Steroidobacter sp. TaxID=1978227 RepID=UPI002ED9352A